MSQVLATDPFLRNSPRLTLCSTARPSLGHTWCAWQCLRVWGWAASGSRGSNILGCHLPPALPRGQLPARGVLRPGQASRHLPERQAAASAHQAPVRCLQAEASGLFLEPGPSPDARIPAEIFSLSN